MPSTSLRHPGEFIRTEAMVMSESSMLGQKPFYRQMITERSTRQMITESSTTENIKLIQSSPSRSTWQAEDSIAKIIQ